jgi:hypothetical protein
MFGDATGAAVGTGWLDEVAWRYRSHCFQALGHAFQVQVGRVGPVPVAVGGHLDVGSGRPDHRDSAAAVPVSGYTSRDGGALLDHRFGQARTGGHPVGDLVADIDQFRHGCLPRSRPE